MAKISTVYEGNLRCRTMNKNGEPLVTDVDKSHGGTGEAYSPVDLTVVALTSCILSVMSIVAKQHGLDLKGARIDADYEMGDQKVRRIGKIKLGVSLPGSIPEAKRPLLERTVKMCPVHNSLHPEIAYEIKIAYI